MTIFDKIATETLKKINRERDDMDCKANARSEMEKTSSLDDTMALVGAVTLGKGLRGIPMQPGIPSSQHGPPTTGMIMNRLPMSQANHPSKVQSTIKTNIRAATHPYQRP